MDWKAMVLLATTVAVSAGLAPEAHGATPGAQQDPEACAKLPGLEAQMACLKRAMQDLQAMSENAEPIRELPPGEPTTVGVPASGACHLKGQSQPVWPNGKPMGPTVVVDQCMANHGAVVADFAQLCEAGLKVAEQAGPSNVVLRYRSDCPANPKSMCSMKNLPREGADANDPDSYTARLDYYFYPAQDQQADTVGCSDKRFF